MFDLSVRLRENAHLQSLLSHYARLGSEDRTVWRDRLMRMDGVGTEQLTTLHGELIAFDGIEQNTGHAVLSPGRNPLGLLPGHAAGVAGVPPPSRRRGRRRATGADREAAAEVPAEEEGAGRVRCRRCVWVKPADRGDDREAIAAVSGRRCVSTGFSTGQNTP